MPLKYLQKMSILATLVSTLSGALPLHAAGTIPLALAVQTDTDGSIAAGCQATFFQAGTVATKQNVYADFGLTQALGNPLSCDQSGRLPMFWIADGLIHVRLTNSAGNPIVDTTMQVLGPSSGGGGGGGGTVDPTSIMATGDLKARYGTGPLSGFVRANGLTIGNASSGASERANADTQALFVYLCGTDLNLVMTPARSGNCLSDFNANKQLATPDWRGRALAFLDDMGNSAAGRLTAGFFGATPTVLGAGGGQQTETLVPANVPSITSTGSNLISVSPNGVGANNFNMPYLTGGGAWASDSYGNGANNPLLRWNAGSLQTAATISGTNAISVTSTGTTGNAFPVVPPTMLATIYVKL